ncbi:Lactonase, 7-bladed beta-propeller-domain-containing protein [Thelephora terrestris]|uniref:Lactonase, 7-bladed beta-propeller-domain-containing protein n=1 Tax=Thelephora terrestris TaxID=56493 RepID=A0A9P6HIB1_9AGAM|nr:Lactonase, 7-bladed beta-propeller-domain-containing protein [Thelephora terrestris]
MVKFNILAGGNIAFIVSYLFDSVDKTLTLIRKNPSGQNTSWIERSVINPSILYAVNEVEAGVIQSFTIFNNGTLSDAIASTSSGGNGPAHVFASPCGEVASMNYAGGTGAIVNTTNNGSDFGGSTFITFPPIGSSGLAHPHETLQLGNEFLVPDLGGDTIWRLVPNADGIFSIGGEIKQPTGSGPRHAAIHRDILVTLHELSSTITSQRIPPLGQNSSGLISNLSIVPLDQAAMAGASFAAAEVLIPSPNLVFNSTLVYASNRNTGTIIDTRGDSIAVLCLSPDGTLQMINQFFTGLNQVRGMQFGGPDNRYLVASGVVGDGGVVVFERVGKGDQFVEVSRNRDIPNLTSFVWVCV